MCIYVVRVQEKYGHTVALEDISAKGDRGVKEVVGRARGHGGGRRGGGVGSSLSAAGELGARAGGGEIGASPPEQSKGGGAR